MTPGAACFLLVPLNGRVVAPDVGATLEALGIGPGEMAMDYRAGMAEVFAAAQAAITGTKFSVQVEGTADLRLMGAISDWPAIASPGQTMWANGLSGGVYKVLQSPIALPPRGVFSVHRLEGTGDFTLVFMGHYGVADVQPSGASFAPPKKYRRKRASVQLCGLKGCLRPMSHEGEHCSQPDCGRHT